MDTRLPTPAKEPPGLKTRRGALTLALLLLVQFLDFLDVSIVNVALPSIKHELGPTSPAAAASSSAGSSYLRSPRSPAASPTPEDCSSPLDSPRESAPP